jgi:cytochrome bd-type quinol oxidase subunit 2
MTAPERARGGVVRNGLVLAALIEAVTVFLRFGLGSRATRDTAWLAPYTFGLRIHHGYVGVVLALLAVTALRHRRRTRTWALTLALALVLSDLFHHFCVLWPLTGTPEFDLQY